MKQKIITTTTIIASLLLGACSSNDFQKTSSGLEYKTIIDNPTAQMPNTSDIVAIRVSYFAPQGNIIEETPLFKIQLTSYDPSIPTIEEGLMAMHEGDSVIFRLPASRLNTPWAQNYTDSSITVAIKMVDVITFDEYERDREAARIAGEREEDGLLNEYLKNNNITTLPELSGLYYIKIKEGEGKSPTPGKNVAIHYNGYFLNGQLFDSSYKRNEPLVFKHGAMQVIQGLDEGIAKMKKGGKAKLIIPSPLAYGDQQTGPIPPFATLIFEVELIDIDL